MATVTLQWLVHAVTWLQWLVGTHDSYPTCRCVATVTRSHPRFRAHCCRRLTYDTAISARTSDFIHPAYRGDDFSWNMPRATRRDIFDVTLQSSRLLQLDNETCCSGRAWLVPGSANRDDNTTFVLSSAVTRRPLRYCDYSQLFANVDLFRKLVTQRVTHFVCIKVRLERTSIIPTAARTGQGQ